MGCWCRLIKSHLKSNSYEGHGKLKIQRYFQSVRLRFSPKLELNDAGTPLSGIILSVLCIDTVSRCERGKGADHPNLHPLIFLYSATPVVSIGLAGKMHDRIHRLKLSCRTNL